MCRRLSDSFSVQLAFTQQSLCHCVVSVACLPVHCSFSPDKVCNYGVTFIYLAHFVYIINSFNPIDFEKYLSICNRKVNIKQTLPVEQFRPSRASIFSSPEHNVLRGSCCDRSSSVVRPSICPSVNNFFKNLLLQNQKANLDKTWQECSLGEAVQKLLKEFNSNKNSGCHGNKMAENGKNL